MRVCKFHAVRTVFSPKQIHHESESESCSVVSNSLQPRGIYSPWNAPGQNTRVGSLALLQGISPTQGSKPGIKPRSPTLQADYQLSHKGNP